MKLLCLCSLRSKCTLGRTASLRRAAKDRAVHGVPPGHAVERAGGAHAGLRRVPGKVGRFGHCAVGPGSAWGAGREREPRKWILIKDMCKTDILFIRSLYVCLCTKDDNDNEGEAASSAAAAAGVSSGSGERTAPAATATVATATVGTTTATPQSTPRRVRRLEEIATCNAIIT